jgi:hypothetical protein
VRRFIFSFACLSFALGLHASVPTATSSAKFSQSSANPTVDHDLRPVQTRQRLPIFVAPADTVSFYVEFYGTDSAHAKAPRKPGLLHRLASAVKKTVQKVNLIPN